MQPALREFIVGASLYKHYDLPYHPGALKYFKDHNIKPRPFSERASATRRRRRPCRAVSRPSRLRRDILQALLLICVIGWVLDVPRRVFGLGLYTEQMLAIALGFSLALIYISGRDRPRALDWLFAALSLGICGYIAFRYEALTYEIAQLPVDLVIGAPS